MDTRFTEIAAPDVQKHFPKFYGQRGRFFEIVHTDAPGPDASGQDQVIGFVGVRPLHIAAPSEDCELEAFIFKQYRNALRKGIVLAVLDLPKTLNFKRCWMKTARKTVIKLFNSMKRYGIAPVGMLNRMSVFVREFR